MAGPASEDEREKADHHEQSDQEDDSRRTTQKLENSADHVVYPALLRHGRCPCRW